MMEDVGGVSELMLAVQNSKLGFNYQWEYIDFQPNFTVPHLAALWRSAKHCELTEIINVICFAPSMSIAHSFKWQSKRNDLS